MQKKQKIFIIITIIAALSAIAFATLSGISFVNKGRRNSLPVRCVDNIYKAVRDGDIYVESDTNGKIYCFDANEPDSQKWEYSRDDVTEGAIAPSVNCLHVGNGAVYAAYGDRYIISFDVTSGEVLNCWYIGYEPRKFSFNDAGNAFAVLGETNGVKAVYVLSASDKGYTLEEPQRTKRSLMLNKDFGLENGCADLKLTDNELYIATETSAILKVPYDSDSFCGEDEITEFFSSDGNFVLLGVDDGRIFALDVNGVYYNFDENGNAITKTKFNATVTTAFCAGDFILAKTKSSELLGITDGKKAFSLSVNGEAIAVFVDVDSFAYVNALGESCRYYKTADAKAVQSAGTTSVVYLVLACVLFVCAAAACFMIFEKSAGCMKKAAVKFLSAIKTYWYCYVALIPTFALLIIFYYYPIVWGLGLSFFDYIPREKSQFVGLANIISVVRNTQFWSSASNMLILLLTDLLKALIPPFIFAECILAVNSKKFSFWTRVLLFIPGILPGVAGTLVWAEGIFGSGSSGLLNGLLSVLDGSFVAKSWLMDPKTALNCLIWFGFPWIGSYLIIYGAISAVPPSMYEAAKLDGCTWFKKIVNLDLPMIVPQIKYVFITSFIASIQDYGRIYVTTKGDFNTATPSLLMYLSITKDKNYGVASAMSLFLFAFLIIATVINFRMQSKSEEQL